MFIQHIIRLTQSCKANCLCEYRKQHIRELLCQCLARACPCSALMPWRLLSVWFRLSLDWGVFHVVLVVVMVGSDDRREGAGRWRTGSELSGTGDVTSGVCQQQSRFRRDRNANKGRLWEFTESVSTSSYQLTATLWKISDIQRCFLCFHGECSQLRFNYCPHKYRKDQSAHKECCKNVTIDRQRIKYQRMGEYVHFCFQMSFVSIESCLSLVHCPDFLLFVLLFNSSFSCFVSMATWHTHTRYSSACRCVFWCVSTF